MIWKYLVIYWTVCVGVVTSELHNNLSLHLHIVSWLSYRAPLENPCFSVHASKTDLKLVAGWECYDGGGGGGGVTASCQPGVWEGPSQCSLTFTVDTRGSPEPEVIRVLTKYQASSYLPPWVCSCQERGDPKRRRPSTGRRWVKSSNQNTLLYWYDWYQQKGNFWS